MATVRIEGIPFELDDAAKFAKRLERASAGSARPGLSPAHALATEIDEAVKAGDRGVAIPEEAREITCRLLDEWYGTGPQSVHDLRRLLCG